jgi:hypothetical protein
LSMAFELTKESPQNSIAPTAASMGRIWEELELRSWSMLCSSKRYHSGGEPVKEARRHSVAVQVLSIGFFSYIGAGVKDWYA